LRSCAGGVFPGKISVFQPVAQDAQRQQASPAAAPTDHPRQAYPRPCTRAELAAGPAQDDGPRPADHPRPAPADHPRQAYPRPCTRAELAAGPAQDDGPGPPIIRAQLQQITRAHTYTHASRPGQKITGPGTTAAAPQAIPPAPTAGQPTTGPAATHSSHQPPTTPNARDSTQTRPRPRRNACAPARF